MQFRTIIAAVDVNDDLTPGVLVAAQAFSDRNNAQLEIVSAWPPATA